MPDDPFADLRKGDAGIAAEVRETVQRKIKAAAMPTEFNPHIYKPRSRDQVEASVNRAIARAKRRGKHVGYCRKHQG